MNFLTGNGLRRRTGILLAFLGIFNMFFGCQMKQEVRIDRTGRGSLTFSTELEDYLVTVIRQLQEFTGDASQVDSDNLVDVDVVEKEFDQRAGLELVHLSSEDSRRWGGKIEFSRIDDAFVSENFSENALKIFRFYQGKEESHLRVVITPDTVRAFLEENPSLDNPIVENFGPLANEGLTNEDYLEMMEYALGVESRVGIKNSAFELVIKPEGKIVEQVGGELLDDSTVRFSIPLLSILVLDEPLIYSLRFE